jgi:hypothetical protein
MKGRGASTKQIADTFGVSLRTVERWGECYPDGRERVPGFRAEVERVRAQSANPTAEGTLLDALSARKDDGVNWQARIAAAVELRRGQNGISATPAATNVHLTIYRTVEGEPTVPPPDTTSSMSSQRRSPPPRSKPSRIPSSQNGSG